MNTPKFGISELVANQASAEITVNEALELLDAVVGARVINQTTTTPPSTPTVGDAYIVAASATGNWTGKDGLFAVYTNGGWRYATVGAGFTMLDKSDSHFYGYNGTAFVRLDN